MTPFFAVLLHGRLYTDDSNISIVKIDLLSGQTDAHGATCKNETEVDTMNNLVIRTALMQHNIKKWQLAQILGMSEPTLYRKLRNELPADEQDRICKLIEEYAQKGGQDYDQATDNG